MYLHLTQYKSDLLKSGYSQSLSRLKLLFQYSTQKKKTQKSVSYATKLSHLFVPNRYKLLHSLNGKVHSRFFSFTYKNFHFHFKLMLLAYKQLLKNYSLFLNEDVVSQESKCLNCEEMR